MPRRDGIHGTTGRCPGQGRARESHGDRGPGSYVLPALCLALRRSGRGDGRELPGTAARPVPPDGSGDLPQGQGGARHREPPRAAAASAQADHAQGGCGPRLGTDHVGRGPGHRRRAAGCGRGCPVAPSRSASARARPPRRRSAMRSTGSSGYVRAFGSPNFSNYMELCGWGRFLAPLYTFGALGARAATSGPRECRLHPLLGVQPVRGTARPRDEHGGRTRARRQALRRRPAQGRAWPPRPTTGCACGPGPTRRSPSRSPT